MYVIKTLVAMKYKLRELTSIYFINLFMKYDHLLRSADLPSLFYHLFGFDICI